MGKKTVSLVLSSGGARGMAHIGAIEALEEAGYEIKTLSGCSAGALIGGIYATGRLPIFKDWICNLDRIDVFSLMDFTLSTKGFIKGIKVFNELKKMIPDCLIEDLPIPFACNAVEIPSGREKIFKKGSLYEAIRASASIPTVFTPSLVNGHEYIDGGIINPLPFNLIPDSLKGDLIVAIDLNGPKTAKVILELPEKIESQSRLPLWLYDYKQKFSNYFNSPIKEESSKTMSSLELMNYSFDLIQDRLSALVLDSNPVDMLAVVSREQAGTLEFHKAKELIEIGRIKMSQAIIKFENGNLAA